MNRDFKKWIICGAIGLALGIFLAIELSNWVWVPMGPLYVVGFAYGAGKIFPWFLNAFGAMGKASFIAFVASKPLLGILVLALLLMGVGLMLAIGWGVGLILAVIALVRAIVEAVQNGGGSAYVPRGRKDREDDLYGRDRLPGDDYRQELPPGGDSFGDDLWQNDSSFSGDGFSGDSFSGDGFSEGGFGEQESFPSDQPDWMGSGDDLWS